MNLCVICKTIEIKQMKIDMNEINTDCDKLWKNNRIEIV